jgi:hypothetical protein
MSPNSGQPDKGFELSPDCEIRDEVPFALIKTAWDQLGLVLNGGREFQGTLKTPDGRFLRFDLTHSELLPEQLVLILEGGGTKETLLLRQKWVSLCIESRGLAAYGKVGNETDIKRFLDAVLHSIVANLYDSLGQPHTIQGVTAKVQSDVLKV